MKVIKMKTQHPMLRDLTYFWTVVSGNDLTKLFVDLQSGTMSEDDKEMFAIILRETQRLVENIDTHFEDIRDGQLIPNVPVIPLQYA